MRRLQGSSFPLSERHGCSTKRSTQNHRIEIQNVSDSNTTQSTTCRPVNPQQEEIKIRIGATERQNNAFQRRQWLYVAFFRAVHCSSEWHTWSLRRSTAQSARSITYGYRLDRRSWTLLSITGNGLWCVGPKAVILTAITGSGVWYDSLFPVILNLCCKHL